MLRRYAITNAVYQPRQCDVVSLSLISNNQTFGNLHLILRWSAGTEIKAQHVIRETHQPVSYLFGESLHR
ncbi:Phage protein [Enterobacter intestinihominis]